MELYEIETLIENLWMRDKTSWEQTRMLSYITAQCQSTKQIDPKDMMTFPWEKTEKVEDSQEERDRIFREMKEMEKKLNEHN